LSFALVGGGYAYNKLSGELNEFNKLDPGAKTVYLNMWKKLKESGNSADATAWKKQI